MGTKAKPAGVVRPSPQVRRWQAEQARRAARSGAGRGRRFRWPADREAIIAKTVTAARGKEHQVNADPPGVCGSILAAAWVA